MSVHVVAAHPFRFRGDAPLPLLFRSVPLALRNTFDGVIRDRPPISYVKRWRKELDVTRTAQVPVMVEAHAAEDNWSQVALELPVARARVAQVDVGRRCRGPMFPLHREEDPLQLILGLDFANFLRNKAEFSAALDAAERFRCGWDAPPRPNDGDQQKRTLARTAEALDIVGMSLQRREFRADRLTNSVRAVNLFTDSSPTTGEEIQGMVMELIRTSSEVCRTLLPGSTLVYGQYNAVAKTVALVWSLWLVCGPFFLRYELPVQQGAVRLHRLRHGAENHRDARHLESVLGVEKWARLAPVQAVHQFRPSPSLQRFARWGVVSRVRQFNEGVDAEGYAMGGYIAAAA